MEHAELVRRIDALPHLGWHGEGWRHVSAGRPPMSGEGARIAGGRWNPPASYAVLYLGTTEKTVVAEFHRLAQGQRVTAADFLPRTLHRYEVQLGDVLDLRDGRGLDALEVTRESLGSDDLRTCQAIGEAAFACGREAVLAPSATGFADVLAVFLERLSPGSTIRDEHAALWEHVPALDSL